MKKRVAVVTDSVACLPPELVQRYDIRVIPLNIILEGRLHRDGVDITPSQVYEALEQGTRPPTTSAPSPGEVAEVYQELSRQASGILCITLSAKLSMMFNVAQQARDIAREALPQTEIMVIDSRTAAGAQGFMVLVAARAASMGSSLVEVSLQAQKLGPKVKVIATFETLRYLAKGGRIGKAASWAGTILNIKPIIHILDGEVAPLERPRSRAGALRRLMEIMEHEVGGKPVHVNLHHADVREEAEALKAEIHSKFDCVELYVTDLTPVMGAHTGPGTVALAFYSED